MIYTDLTKKAIKLCFEAHAGQLDKSGLPYVLHPLHLAEQMDDEDSTIVALLHDVVEDTRITFDDIHPMGFGPDVIEALMCLTHDEEMPYEQYIELIKENPLATKVKLADLEHNSDITRLNGEPTEKDLRRVEKYKRAKEYLLSNKVSRTQAKDTDEPLSNMTVLPESDNIKLVIRLERGQTIYLGKHDLYKCNGNPKCVSFLAILGEEVVKKKRRKIRNRRMLSICETCGKVFAVGAQMEKLMNWNKLNNNYFDLRYINQDGEVARMSPPINYKDNAKNSNSGLTNNTQSNRVAISGKDFLVRTGTQYCSNKEHAFKDIRALVKVMDSIGKIKVVDVPAVYCADCKQHYILEGDYQKLLKIGRPICKVVTLETYRGLRNGSITMNEESLLHAMGYNVGAKDDIPQSQRQHLLTVIIREGVLKRSEVLSHLDYLIRRSRNVDRLEEARGKWQSDRDYVSKLTPNDLQEINVGSIKRVEVKER